MPHATPGKWFLSVVCECSHRTLLFRDLNEGKAELMRTLVLTTCPNCQTEASRLMEHYQVPLVKRVSGEL